jgi:hypothetical protein
MSAPAGNATRLISYLALGELRLDGWPCLTLCSIREQIHDDGTLADGLVHLEQVCAWDPAVLLCLLPRLPVLSYTDDDVETIVAEIETLTVTLRAIADQSERVVLEVFLPDVLVSIGLVRRSTTALSLPGASPWANLLSRTLAPCGRQSRWS